MIAWFRALEISLGMSETKAKTKNNKINCIYYKISIDKNYQAYFLRQWINGQDDTDRVRLDGVLGLLKPILKILLIQCLYEREFENLRW
jgi:hypothetical protein